MNRISLFNSPLLLGFDNFERVFERIAKNPSEGYPPYNIEQIGENGLRISIAVAGFSKEDISVTVEDNQLIIRGKCSQDESEKIYLHRGIATRQFQRTFILADGVEVKEAEFNSGLLHIDLEKPTIKTRVKNVEIREGILTPRKQNLTYLENQLKKKQDS